MMILTYFEACKLRRALPGLRPAGLGILCALLERSPRNTSDLIDAGIAGTMRKGTTLEAYRVFSVSLSQLRAVLPADVIIHTEGAAETRRYRLTGGEVLLAIARPQSQEQAA